MACPNLSVGELQKVFPEIEFLGNPLPGGQKLVFPCRLASQKFVIKILEPGAPSREDATPEATHIVVNEVFERAKREVEILKRCRTKHLPKLGPIQLQQIEISGKVYVAFSEEYIDGADIQALLEAGFHFTPIEILALATDVTRAISEIWSHKKIHRDIKPKNIMRRRIDGSYVLLDPGIAFDLEDDSLTADGFVPHTLGYISPEGLNLAQKRESDFRSDFFLLGIVLYLCATKVHPFRDGPLSQRADINRAILTRTPPAPHERNNSIPMQLSQIIMRLLEKKRHARYRTCEILISELESISLGG